MEGTYALKASGLLLLLSVSMVNGGCLKAVLKSSKTYTTQVASVLTSVAYISEFELQCENGKLDFENGLYAEINGQFNQVAQTGPNKYQVSWTEELAKATRGDHSIKVYDQESFANVRKAQRAGLEPKVSPLVTVALYHPGQYTGPWLNSENLAAIMGIAVVYIAITSRNKLLS